MKTHSNGDIIDEQTETPRAQYRWDVPHRPARWARGEEDARMTFLNLFPTLAFFDLSSFCGSSVLLVDPIVLTL